MDEKPFIGDKMTVCWDIRTSTVGGTPSNVLNIAVPGGVTVAGTGTFLGTGWNDQNGTQSTGTVSLDGGGTNIFNFVQAATATAWTASTDTTRVIGSITFSIS